MADKEIGAVVDLRWMANGEPDPHPRYIEIGREELAGAHRLSDDELAYALALMSTIGEEEDTRRMIQSHRTGGDYICKSLLGEIAKDRIRWLSRRVAVLEGRYPGSTPPAPVALDEIVVESPSVMAEALLEQHLPRLASVIGINATTPDNMIQHILRERGISLNSTKVGIVFGHLLSKSAIHRWHIYVEMTRDLLRQNFYVPFVDDRYQLRGKSLFITYSKYLPSGADRILRHELNKEVTSNG